MRLINGILILSLLYSFSNAACPFFEYFPALNLPLQGGVWYIHGVIKEGPVTTACIKLDLRSNSWGTFPVSVQATVEGRNLSDATQPYTQEYSATIPSFSFPARWKVDVDGIEYEYAILHTDYMEYSLTVTCYTVNATEFTEVQFASRSQDTPMPSTVIENLKEKIKDYYGVNGTFQRVLQSGITC